MTALGSACQPQLKPLLLALAFRGQGAAHCPCGGSSKGSDQSRFITAPSALCAVGSVKAKCHRVQLSRTQVHPAPLRVHGIAATYVESYRRTALPRHDFQLLIHMLLDPGPIPPCLHDFNRIVVKLCSGSCALQGSSREQLATSPAMLSKDRQAAIVWLAESHAMYCNRLANIAGTRTEASGRCVHVPGGFEKALY